MKDLILAAKAAVIANLRASEALASSNASVDNATAEAAAAFAQAAQMNAGTLTVLVHNDTHEEAGDNESGVLLN
jgi:hypothetical protein